MALEDLTDELSRYCAEHDLPSMSADELACEISAVLNGENSEFVPGPANYQRAEELRAAESWLQDFCRRWDDAEDWQRFGSSG